MPKRVALLVVGFAIIAVTVAIGAWLARVALSETARCGCRQSSQPICRETRG
jgi:hypothetical protein